MRLMELCFRFPSPLFFGARAKSRVPKSAKRHIVAHAPIPSFVLPSTAAPPLPEPSEGGIWPWVSLAPIAMPDVDVATIGLSRHLVAKRDLIAGTNLVTIPACCALSVHTGAEAPIPSFRVVRLSSLAWERLPWASRLAIVLLDELRAGETSPFRNYILALPNDPPGYIWARVSSKDDGETIKSQLQRVGLQGHAERIWEAFEQEWATVEDEMDGGKLGVICKREYAWAVSIVQSRAFRVPRGATGIYECTEGDDAVEFALFPGLDMANHSAQWGSSFEYVADADAFSACTRRNVAKNAQVFLNYGPKSSAESVLYYGFVEANNPSNAVNFPPAWVQAAEVGSPKLRSRKGDLRRWMGIENATDEYAIRVHDVDNKLMMLLRIAVADEADVEKMTASVDAAQIEGRAVPLTNVSLTNEIRAWQVLEARCSELLVDVDDTTLRRLREELERQDGVFSAVWEWGSDQCDAESLMAMENNRVLQANIDRIHHYKTISKKIGRVCTVLVPPGQSLLRADLFGVDPTSGNAGSGVHRFVVDPV